MSPRSSRRPCIVEPLESRQMLTVISGFAETTLASGMTRPVQMAFAPDGRLFITQQDGKLRVFKNGQLLGTPFVTVSTHNTGERGLLGVTLDPNFASNKFVYVYYTHPNGDGTYRNRVSRFTANGDVAASGSEDVLIETDNLGSGTWHNAGALEFGADGKLYVGVGENQQNSIAQSKTSLLGKILRINPDGSIPSDNPFYNQTTGKYRSIWALGLRNPFTMDTQPGTGRLFVNDVGAARFEEINELVKGANYGWPNAEGPSTNSSFTNPFYSYAHAGGENDDSAITGAAWYNPTNRTFPSDYVGDFFFGDFGLGTIKRIDVATKQVSGFVSNVLEITDVETGPDGAIYYLQRSAGRLVRVQSTTTSAPSIATHPQSQTVALGQSATFTVEANGANLSYQWQRNGNDIAGANAASFTINSTTSSDHNDAFRCVVSNSAGTVTSNAATLTVLTGNAPEAGIANGPIPPWTGGSTVSFSGTGTDEEDGTLPAGAFTWRVDLHHDTHAHPFIAPYSGVRSDSFEVPDVGHDAEHNIWYRIHLTVRDSTGLEDTTFVDVFPRKVNLSVTSDPAGIPLSLDGAPLATPYSDLAIVGFRRPLSAPATATLNGVFYEFDGWSDAGAASHDVVIPATDVTYTARYKVSTQAPPQTLTLRATADAHVRDGTYASQNFGSATEMQVKSDGPDRTRYGYLMFDLTGVGPNVTSAKLKLRARLDNTLASSVVLTAFSSPGGWSESGITWNNKPTPGASAIGSVAVAGTTAKDYELDLTTYFRALRGAGVTSGSIVLQAASAKATTLITSDESASNKPQLVIASDGGSPGPGPSPTPDLLRVTADSYVRDGASASTNFGSSSELQVKQHSSAGYERETYLKFDLSSLTSITSAKLRLNGRLTESATVQTAVFSAADTGWGESSLTWNNRPATGASSVALTTVSGTSSKWYEWDVTALLQSEKAAGRNVVTLVLKNLSQTGATLIFASDEAASNRPELVVT